jgi:hypothetical protein
MLPVVGEALDVVVLLDDEASTVDKGIASASLAVNAVTFGLLPNFGAVHRSGSRAIRDLIADTGGAYVPRGARGASGGGAPARRVNLPAWRRVQIDMGHIASGHMLGGTRVSPSKGLFPDYMSTPQVERAVRQAYRRGRRVGRQNERVLLRGEHAGLTIEMWVNRQTKTIETAYPVFR